MLHKFTLKFILFFSLIVGIVCYYRLCVEPIVTGDLCRMLCLPLVSPDYEQQIEDKMAADYGIVVKDIDTYNGKDTCDYDLLIIGDSFTNAISTGQIPFSLLLGQLSGLSAARMNGDLQGFVDLINKGFIQSGTKVVVESVERYAITRFRNIDFSRNYNGSLVEDDSPIQEMLNTKNNTTRFSCMTRACVWLRSLLNIGPAPMALDLQLSSPMFSNGKNSKTLLFYKEDLGVRDVDLETKAEINNNIIRAWQLADSVGVNLVFLIATDKYDFYYPWIINPPTVENHTFDYFPCDSSFFIDTKTLLRPYAEQGVKDIYKFSDTHWSTIASYIVAKEVLQRLKH